MVRVLLFLAVVVVLAAVLWPILREWGWPIQKTPSQARDELVKDPTCQTYVVRSRAVRRDVEGHTFYFCSSGCADRFLRGERTA